MADLRLEAANAQRDAKNNAVSDAPFAQQCACVQCRMSDSSVWFKSVLRILVGIHGGLATSYSREIPTVGCRVSLDQTDTHSLQWNSTGEVAEHHTVLCTVQLSVTVQQ